MSEEYGFVYVWFDRKHKRYYVGCHWGHEDDGYICSSSWMKRAYKIRPHDFRRRIVKRIEDKSMLFEEEGHWLAKIKNDELGKRYYNLHNIPRTHWSVKHNSAIVKEKISSSHCGIKWSDERRSKWKERCNTEENKNKASLWSKNFSEELRRQIANTRRGKKIHTEESKRKIGDTQRNRVQSPEEREKRATSLRGKERTIEARRNISEGCKGRIFTDEHRAKLSASAKARKYKEKK